MKSRHYTIICAILLVVTVWMTTAKAMSKTPNDGVEPEKLNKIYSALSKPEMQGLTTAQFIEAFEKTDRQATKFLGKLHGDQLKKETLIRYAWIFNTLGRYSADKERVAKSELQAMLAKLTAGFDPDSPDLELLSDSEVTKLLDCYMSAMHPALSNSANDHIYRATHVLYTIKSDKVRKAYVEPVLNRVLNDYGYTGLAQGLFEDIAMCVKDNGFLEYAAGLETGYQTLDAGQQAPQITMENIAGEIFHLTDYAGKYVLIYVWSAQSKGYEHGLTAFADLRSKYPHENFAAIALSVDPKEQWWELSGDNVWKSGRVTNMRTSDVDAFANDYKTGFMPRYILINNEGGIINAWFRHATDFFMINQLEAALNPHLISH